MVFVWFGAWVKVGRSKVGMWKEVGRSKVDMWKGLASTILVAHELCCIHPGEPGLRNTLKLLTVYFCLHPYQHDINIHISTRIINISIDIHIDSRVNTRVNIRLNRSVAL